MTLGPVGPDAESLDMGMVVGGSMVSGGSLGGTGGNGASGSGIRLSGSPPRDSAKGKSVVVETEEPSEILIERVEFQPAAGFSGHRPITKEDFVEFVDDALLDLLLQDNPTIVTAVMAAREERQKAIALALKEERLRDEAERARVEGEDALREMEVAERARAEAELPRRSVETVATGMERAKFSATAYVPPTPHLFVPSDFAAYRPQ